MPETFDPSNPFSRVDTTQPERVRALQRTEVACQIVGVLVTVIDRGLTNVTTRLHWELGLIVILAMLILTVSLILRYRWSLKKPTFIARHLMPVGISGLWLLGTLGILIFGPFLPADRGALFIGWSELCIVLRGVSGAVTATRRAAAQGANPAVILAASFALLITLGTILLMLPRARAETAPQDEPFSKRLRIACFTATSASCVTGLVVVDTGGETPYWSRLGQCIILCLFQIGGLGIMTCGAFFAVTVGRTMAIKESVTLGDMLETPSLAEVRRLLRAILAFTLISEALGALAISGLWSDKPLGEQIYFSVFHSVSAFCNAGFSLTDASFEGDGDRWQVWGPMTILILLGGFGFSTLYNVILIAKDRFSTIRVIPLFGLHKERIRLTLTSKLVLWTSLFLAVGGAVGFFALESTGDETSGSIDQRVADAWFQSVTFRTAGFNTVNLGELQPATKLFAIGLMFIGAAPGSTGGGVKVTCFALSVLALFAIIRRRDRVEIMGRTIPDLLINRALLVVALGMVVVMGTTLLLVLFEPDGETRFLDYLFEATSAFGTVGVSTGVTPTLTPSSQLVIMVTMFLGRVGPLTLMVALSRQSQGARYAYPAERVLLG